MLLIWIYPDSVALALDGMLLIQTVYLIYESRVVARLLLFRGLMIASVFPAKLKFPEVSVPRCVLV